MADFETRFRVEGDLVYNLKQQGWNKGEPNMVNDVMVRVTQQQGELCHPNAKMAEVAQAICDVLNEKYTFEDDKE